MEGTGKRNGGGFGRDRGGGIRTLRGAVLQKIEDEEAHVSKSEGDTSLVLSLSI